jgi:pimeloyl-ACP methyl ester carboxylesterase
MHYLSTESTTADANALIIFLHGFYLWEQQLRSSLASKAKLVALDLPGCGGSDSLSFYGPDEILNSVAEAVIQLKIRFSHQSTSTNSTRQRSMLVSHDW